MARKTGPLGTVTSRRKTVRRRKAPTELDNLRDLLYRAKHLVAPDQNFIATIERAIRETEQTEAAEQAKSREAVQAQRRQDQGAERHPDEGRLPAVEEPRLELPNGIWL